MFLMSKKFFYIQIIFSVYISLFTTLNAQSSPSQVEQVKMIIEGFQKRNDIISINKTLNRNTFLPPEYTIEIIHKNLQSAEKLQNKEALADTYLTLGNFWYIQGDFVKAYDYYSHCENISISNKFLRLEGISKLNKSNLTEKLPLKIEVLKNAVRILERAKDTLNLAKGHLNLGSAYEKFVFNNTDEKFEKVTDSLKIMFYKENAFFHYNVAQELNSVIKNSEINASLQTHFGDWNMFEKQFPDAKNNFENAGNYFNVAGRVKGMVYSKMRIAQIFEDENDTEEALQYLYQAEKLALEYEYKDYLTDIYKKITHIYKDNGNYQKAYFYHELYTVQALKLAELNSEDKIHIVNLQHDLSRKEYATVKYEQQKKINMVILFISIITIISISLISYLIIQNKKRKADNSQKKEKIAELEKEAIAIKLKSQLLQEELLKEKIQFSQNNLVEFANQVNKINSFLSILKTEMKQIKQNNLGQDKINSLRLSFSEIVNEQHKLSQINSYSSKLNQEFFFYIQKNYTEISKEDELLLANIILNKTTKDISTILNISNESVYKKRYRLRKKLNLQPEETFEGFYNKIIADINRGKFS